MNRNVTTLLAAFLLAGPVLAQTQVTVRQINEIPQAQIDQLNGLADGVSGADINNCGSLIYNALCGTEVTITAVVMSDPLNSGLASVGSDGRPGRIHIFVRDVAAETEGAEGHGIQVVDGSNNLGFDGLVVGDVIEITGTVGPFFTTMQMSPTTTPNVIGSRDPASDPFFDPIAVTTADLNADAGADGAIRINWDNLWKYRGSLVRFEDATALTRTSGSRVDWNWTTDNGATSVSMYDTSLRYRNDRSDYPSNFNRRSSRDPFEAPVPGAKLNLQGFATFNGGTSSDPFGLAVPNGMALAVNPWNDSDIEITESPPTISADRPSAVPNSTDGLTVTADITADPARSLSTASASYTLPDGTTKAVAEAFFAGSTYTFIIPGSDLSDGDYITYSISATDNTGAESVSGDLPVRVLDDGINEIADIQTTESQGPGGSPFVNMSVDVDITATVQVDASTGFMTLQDDAGQAGWSGIVIDRADNNSALVALNRGDVIRLTHVKPEENFGFTRLDETDIAFEVVSTGGDPIAPKVITTDLLQDSAIAEPHEGMVLEIQNPVMISTNADAPSGPFGEFSISSDGDAANALRVDDVSDTWIVPNNDRNRQDPSLLFNGNERFEFVRGTLWYSFSNYKLEPADPADIGPVTNTSVEGDDLPRQVTLHQNYPNPFNPTTSITYDLAVGGDVELKVFDVLGRHVRTLVQGMVPAGQHSVQFDASKLTSGMYLYSLRTEETTVLRHMMLVK